MARLGAIAASMGALLALVPTEQANAQSATGFVLKPPSQLAEDSPSASKRFDFGRLQEDPFAQPLNVLGIPLVEQKNRERGFSFGVRPVKGVRAVAKLRF